LHFAILERDIVNQQPELPFPTRFNEEDLLLQPKLPAQANLAGKPNFHLVLQR
jgi:hypothetical protein